MNHSHSAITINQSDGSNSMTATPLRQALLDIEEEHSSEIQRLFDRVRTGAHVWNAQFDRILPLCWRRFSIMHWTPVQVARRAAQFLVSGPETQVLDVGSGAGKFCLVGALATQGNFTGVEQRPHLAELSRSFAHKYAIPRVRFLCANAGDLDWSRFNAFYFYNPFYENLDPDKKLDERVELSPSLYDRYIKMTQDRLAQAPSGTRVVTFHGMGGDLPGDYKRVFQEFQDIGFLELWIKDPSPEEMIFLQQISRRPEDLQEPRRSARDRAGGETSLWVSICAAAPAAAHDSED